MKPPAVKPPKKHLSVSPSASVGIGFSAFEGLSLGIGAEVGGITKVCGSIKTCGKDQVQVHAKAILAKLKTCNKHISKCKATISGKSKGALCGKFGGKGAAVSCLCILHKHG